MQIAVEWLWLTNICRVIKLKLVCTQISWISTISMHVLINETHSYFPSLIENLWAILSDKWEKVHSTLKYISLTWRFYIWKGKKQTEGREKPFEGEHRGRRRSGNSWFQLRILTGVFISSSLITWILVTMKRQLKKNCKRRGGKNWRMVICWWMLLFVFEPLKKHTCSLQCANTYMHVSVSVVHRHTVLLMQSMKIHTINIWWAKAHKHQNTHATHLMQTNADQKKRSYTHTWTHTGPSHTLWGTEGLNLETLTPRQAKCFHIFQKMHKEAVYVFIAGLTGLRGLWPQSLSLSDLIFNTPPGSAIPWGW